MDTESQWIFDRMRLYKLWQAHVFFYYIDSEK